MTNQVLCGIKVNALTAWSPMPTIEEEGLLFSHLPYLFIYIYKSLLSTLNNKRV